MFALKRATFAFGLSRSDCHVDLMILLPAFGYFVGWALPLIQIEAITKHAGHNMRAIPIAYSSETMTAFGPHGPEPLGSYGCYLDRAFGAADESIVGRHQHRAFEGRRSASGGVGNRLEQSRGI